MAVGSFPDQPFDPAHATPTGNQFYPPQNDPDVTLLPPKRAPVTTSNVWEAVKITNLQDFSPVQLSQIPCMRSSMLQGIAGGVGFAMIRLLTGKPGSQTVISALGWFAFSFAGIGGAANLYCNQKRNEELQMMRLIYERFPERNIRNVLKRQQADSDSHQVAEIPSPPKVEVSQPGYINVSDSDGNFLGKMTPAMAELAKSRGASETFEEVKGEAGLLPPSGKEVVKGKSWKTLWL